MKAAQNSKKRSDPRNASQLIPEEHAESPRMIRGSRQQPQRRPDADDGAGEAVLSPASACKAQTPPAVPMTSSSHLFGEDFVNTASRRSSSGSLASPTWGLDDCDDYGDEDKKYDPVTPPSYAGQQSHLLQSISPPPPPLLNSALKSSSKQRPPRVPHVHLQRQNSGGVGGGGGLSQSSGRDNSASHGQYPHAPHQLSHRQLVPQQLPVPTTTITRPSNIAQHNRAASSGDGSFMSALTESSYEGAGLNQSNHLRTRSWEFCNNAGFVNADPNNTAGARSLPSGGYHVGDAPGEVREMNIHILSELQQPVLTDENLLLVTPPCSPDRSSARSSSNSKAKVTTSTSEQGDPETRVSLSENTARRKSLAANAKRLFPEVTPLQKEVEKLILHAIESLKVERGQLAAWIPFPSFSDNYLQERASEIASPAESISDVYEGSRTNLISEITMLADALAELKAIGVETSIGTGSEAAFPRSLRSRRGELASMSSYERMAFHLAKLEGFFSDKPVGLRTKHNVVAARRTAPSQSSKTPSASSSVPKLSKEMVSADDKADTLSSNFPLDTKNEDLISCPLPILCFFALYLAGACLSSLVFGLCQIVTISLAQATETALVHYLDLSSSGFIQTVGPRKCLFFFLSTGWPR